MQQNTFFSTHHIECQQETRLGLIKIDYIGEEGDR